MFDDADDAVASNWTREDQHLWDRVRAGDSQAFDKLMRRHMRVFEGAAASVLGDRHFLVDVAVAQALKKVWISSRAFDARNGVSPIGWWYKIAKTRALNVRRRYRHHQDVRTPTDPHRVLQSRAADWTGAPDPGPKDAALRRTLDRMRPKDREILSLRYSHELSLDEICEVLRLKPSAAKMRLKRARERFEKLWSEGQ